jgi:membrane-bound serine protease (ClpP class)
MTQLFFIFLIVGLTFIGAEIFVPGGILGFLGGLALLGASIISFIHPNITTSAAFAITGGIIFAILAVIGLWIKIFPKTWIGKHMMVNSDLGDAKATETGAKKLLGKTGISISPLHPGGYAEIEDHRYDVITQGEMIDCGKQISVIEVEGNRIVVQEDKQQKE